MALARIHTVCISKIISNIQIPQSSRAKWDHRMAYRSKHEKAILTVSAATSLLAQLCRGAGTAHTWFEMV